MFEGSTTTTTLHMRGTVQYQVRYTQQQTTKRRNDVRRHRRVMAMAMAMAMAKANTRRQQTPPPVQEVVEEEQATTPSKTSRAVLLLVVFLLSSNHHNHQNNSHNFSSSFSFPGVEAAFSSSSSSSSSPLSSSSSSSLFRTPTSANAANGAANADAIDVATPVAPVTTKNVLVVGGSGRVGGSTVSWLETFNERNSQRSSQRSSRSKTTIANNNDLNDNLLPNLQIFVGGRKAASFERALQEQKLFSNSIQFVQLDIELDSEQELTKKLTTNCGCKIDLVVHTGGPFQGRRNPKLLKVCLDNSIPYVDVCDEYELALRAKTDLHDVAISKNVPAVVCGGIWPGISSCMAMETFEQLLLLQQQQQQQEKEEEEENNDVNVDIDVDVDVEYSFFTAGTGNAGPTIVSATFLLLATPVMTFMNSRPKYVEPWTQVRDINFGNHKVGTKPVWLLDNPDVPTTASALLSFIKSSSSSALTSTSSSTGTTTTTNISYNGNKSTTNNDNNNNRNINIRNVNVSSRFGTDPLIWNYLFGMIKTLVPTSLLQNQNLMQQVALFSEPIIRLVDKFVGSTNAMRVDVTLLSTTSTSTTTTSTTTNTTTTKKTSLIVHPDLESCVGLATAAFALEVLKSSSSSRRQQQQQQLNSTGTDTYDDDGDDGDDVSTIIPPGVWYPSELPTSVRRRLLDIVKEDAITYEV